MTAAARITKVEHQELLARATELEQPIGRVPQITPRPPCALPEVVRAARDLDLSAEHLRTSLDDFRDTRAKLAKSLRNAARAYLLTDQGAAESIDGGSPAEQAMLAGAAAEDSGPGSALRGGAALQAPKAPDILPPEVDKLHDLEQKSFQIEQNDQGLSFRQFIQEWADYRVVLRGAKERFRPFDEWQGDAADAVYENFKTHRDWLEDMAARCQSLVDLVDPILPAFRKLRRDHVPLEGVTYDYRKLKEFEKFWTDNMHSGYGQFMKKYAELSKNSKDLLDEFMREARLPLVPISALSTRQASKIDPPKPYSPPGPPPPPVPPLPPIPPMPPIPDSGNNPTPFVPSGGGGLPMTPSTPTKIDTDPKLAPAFKAPDLKGGHGGGGMKPMSFEGAGAGAAPLGTWDDAASTKAASAGAGAGGRGVPGLGATGAGAGGGMGGGGLGQGAKEGAKGKRVQGDTEEALYTEDREWTEGIIGRRSTKQTPNQG
jgi:hypothetical protein